MMQCECVLVNILLFSGVRCGVHMLMLGAWAKDVLMPNEPKL